MPPYSSGIGIASTPFSANSSSMSRGYSSFSSISAARGATRSCTSSRIVSRIASCSSEKSKSMGLIICPSEPGGEDLAGDHDPLALVRALVDLQRLGVAEVALEGAGGQVALLPRQLRRRDGKVHGRVRAEQLGHRSLAGERPALPAQHRRVVGELPG